MKSAFVLVVLAWGSVVWAGEIVMSPPKSNAPVTTDSGKEASRQREAARDYRKEHIPDTPTIVVVPDDEEGMLSPHRSSSSSAAENTARARANRQSDSGSGAVVPPILSPEAPTSGSRMDSTQRARDNRNRAAEYRTGEQKSDRRFAVVGKDGLPIIDCSATENVAGRIGDDTHSGSVVILIQDRNQIKVRCR